MVLISGWCYSRVLLRNRFVITFVRTLYSFKNIRIRDTGTSGLNFEGIYFDCRHSRIRIEIIMLTIRVGLTIKVIHLTRWLLLTWYVPRDVLEFLSRLSGPLVLQVGHAGLYTLPRY